MHGSHSPGTEPSSARSAGAVYPAASRAESSAGSSSAHPVPTQVTPAALVAWGLAATCYLLAIFHRMALGVAAIDAESRLAVGAGAVAALSVVGLTAYLLLQVPAGLVSDRIGPRRGLALGLGVIAVGEALFASSTSLPVSLLGRGLVGAGDAFIFLNVLRIVAHWFPRERFAQMTAATATLGATGQIIGTLPLSRALQGMGWEGTFWLSAGATLAFGGLALAFLRDRPAGHPAPPRHAHAPILTSLRRSWARPATRDGFWVHFTTVAPFVVVTGLWGAPILIDAQGMSRDAASTVLLIAVAVSAAAALVAGAHVRRRPAMRHATALWTSIALVAALGVLTFVPATVMPPAGSLLCIAVLGIGMGVGMIGFDLAQRAGAVADGASTTALVNLGGYSAAIAGCATVAVARTTFGADSGLVLLPTFLIAAFGLWRLTTRPGWQRRSRGWREVSAEREPVAGARSAAG